MLGLAVATSICASSLERVALYRLRVAKLSVGVLTKTIIIGYLYDNRQGSL